MRQTDIKAGSTIATVLADSIKEFKRKNNLTDAQFAARCSFTQSKVQRIVSGNHPITLTDFLSVCSALQVKASQLLRMVGQ